MTTRARRRRLTACAFVLCLFARHTHAAADQKPNPKLEAHANKVQQILQSSQLQKANESYQKKDLKKARKGFLAIAEKSPGPLAQGFLTQAAQCLLFDGDANGGRAELETIRDRFGDAWNWQTSSLLRRLDSFADLPPAVFEVALEAEYARSIFDLPKTQSAYLKAIQMLARGERPKAKGDEVAISKQVSLMKANLVATQLMPMMMAGRTKEVIDRLEKVLLPSEVSARRLASMELSDIGSRTIASKPEDAKAKADAIRSLLRKFCKPGTQQERAEYEYLLARINYHYLQTIIPTDSPTPLKKQQEVSAQTLRQFRKAEAAAVGVPHVLHSVMYFLSEMYLFRNAPQEAEAVTTAFADMFPESALLASMKLKAAIVHANWGNRSIAADKLNQVAESFPKSSEAEVADGIYEHYGIGKGMPRSRRAIFVVGNVVLIAFVTGILVLRRRRSS